MTAEHQAASRRVKKTWRKAATETRAAAARPAFQLTARWVYGVRGLLCGGMGALAVLQVLLGASGTLRRDSVQGIVAAALAEPAGRELTAVAGIIAIIAGLAQFVDAWRASFKGDLKRGKMNKEEFQTALLLGRVG